jgi:hypothetical protein
MEGTLPRCRTGPHFPLISGEFMSSEMECKARKEPSLLERLFAWVREKFRAVADIRLANAGFIQKVILSGTVIKKIDARQRDGHQFFILGYRSVWLLMAAFGSNPYLGQFLSGFALSGLLFHGIANGDEHTGLETRLEVEKPGAELGVEVADPTGAEALFGGSKAEMFHGDGHVDVGMVFAVGRPVPRLVVIGAGDEVHGCFGEPVAVVATAKFAPCVIAFDGDELPWLHVDSGWRHADALHDVFQFFGLDGFVGVGPNGMTAFGKIDELHYCKF